LTETRVLEYLSRADSLPHRKEGEDILVEHIPFHAKTILDLGTVNGRLVTKE
jgi:hypothetical protein